jgi:protein-tyrosine-phosphatase
MRGPNGEELPDAVLFACTRNGARSPMAAALMAHLYGKFIHIESVGVYHGALDPFAVEVMAELGLDIAGHRGRTFEELGEPHYDLVISFTPEAHHKAMELTRRMAIATEYWPTLDPSAFEGSREQRLLVYRQVRDEIARRLRARFSVRPSPAP